MNIDDGLQSKDWYATAPKEVFLQECSRVE